MKFKQYTRDLDSIEIQTTSGKLRLQVCAE